MSDEAGLVRRVVWGRGWLGPYESVYTLALKMAWANGNSFTSALRVFGMSALERPLYAPPVPAIPAVDQGANTLIRSQQTTATVLGTRSELALVDAAGPQWLKALSVNYFRYCPACLGHGYQTPFFQIAAMKLCPVHRVQLLLACRACGERTSGYSVGRADAKAPFICRHCNRPILGTLDVVQWFRTSAIHSASETAFGVLYDWLEALSRNFRVKHLESQARRHDPLHAFWMANRMLPVPASLQECFESLPSNLAIYPLRESAIGRWNAVDRGDALEAVYRRVRARLVRQCPPEHRAWLKHLHRVPIDLDGYRSVPVEIPAFVQALARWRGSFEVDLQLPCYFQGKPLLRFRRPHISPGLFAPSTTSVFQEVCASGGLDLVERLLLALFATLYRKLARCQLEQFLILSRYSSRTETPANTTRCRMERQRFFKGEIAPYLNIETPWWSFCVAVLGCAVSKPTAPLYVLCERTDLKEDRPSQRHVVPPEQWLFAQVVNRNVRTAAQASLRGVVSSTSAV